MEDPEKRLQALTVAKVGRKQALQSYNGFKLSQHPERVWDWFLPQNLQLKKKGRKKEKQAVYIFISVYWDMLQRNKLSHNVPNFFFVNFHINYEIQFKGNYLNINNWSQKVKMTPFFLDNLLKVMTVGLKQDYCGYILRFT